MTKKNLFKHLVPVGVLLGFASMASATLVGPGVGPAPITGDPLPTGGTIVASIVDNTVTSAPMSVTYSEWVYQESGGNLDFIIQVLNNNGPDVVDRVTGESFTGNGGVTTDLGFSASAPLLPTITGGVDPTNGDRLADGSVVGFDFALNGSIPTGGHSDYLVIETNATQWVPGFVGFQDGSGVSGPGFGVAPEPNMACLLSVLGVGILGVAYRRKKNVVKNTEV